MARVNRDSFRFSSSLRVLLGVILTVTDAEVWRRRIISVAKRVQRPALRGNGICVMASSTELFPDD